MVSTLFFLTTVVAADAPSEQRSAVQLIVTSNAKSILQRDHLLLRTMIANRGKREIAIDYPQPSCHGSYLLIEMKRGDSWERIRTANEEQLGEGCDLGGRQDVASGSHFVEYNAFHRQKKAFLFDQPGEYLLRASASVDGTVLRSDPIKVNVEPRSADALERIAKGPAEYVQLRTLKWNLSETTIRMQDMGGNIRMAISTFQMLKEYLASGRIDGKEVAKNEAIKLLEGRLDRVTFDEALRLLADHYYEQRQIEDLAQIVQAMPFESSTKRQAISRLQFLLNTVPPR